MFRPSAIVHTTAASYRQVDFWCRQGYIFPDFPGDGPGTDRWFLGPSFEHARSVADLVMVGVKPRLAMLLAMNSFVSVTPKLSLTLQEEP